MLAENVGFGQMRVVWAVLSGGGQVNAVPGTLQPGRLVLAPGMSACLAEPLAKGGTECISAKSK